MLTARRRQRAIWLTRRGAASTAEAASRTASAAAAGWRSGAPAEAVLDALDQLHRILREQHELVLGHLARVELGVADGQAVGDDGTAPCHRLEAGHAARRVHEHVRGGEQVRHLIGEAEHAHPLVARKAAAQPLALDVVAPGQADDGRVGDRRQLRDGALEVADAPAAAGDDDHAPVGGQSQRGARSAALARLQELGGDQRAHDLRAAAPGDPLDVVHGLLVHHEVRVDTALRPEEEPGHVGDRRHRRHIEQAPAAQVAEDDGDRRIGRHDDVRVAGEDRAPQRRRAEPAEHLLGDQAHRREVLEHPVVGRVGARRDAQLRAVPVGDNRAQALTHRREAVDDRDLDRLAAALELLAQGARCRGVPLPDIGGEDQHALRASGTRKRWRVCEAEAQGDSGSHQGAIRASHPTLAVPQLYRSQRRKVSISYES